MDPTTVPPSQDVLSLVWETMQRIMVNAIAVSCRRRHPRDDVGGPTLRERVTMPQRQAAIDRVSLSKLVLAQTLLSPSTCLSFVALDSTRPQQARAPLDVTPEMSTLMRS